MYHCLNLGKYFNNKGITNFEDRECGELDSLTRLSILDIFLRRNMNFLYQIRR